MLSIIVCSKNIFPEKNFSENIKNTIGIEYEIVHIDNSNNQYSIFEAYNIGIERSKFEHLCFLHDDVCFVTQNWGGNIITHLSTPNIGLIGIAGGNLVCKVPSGWFALDEFMNIIQSDKDNNSVKKHILKPIKLDKNSVSVVAIDGVLMCARKEIFKSIKFDNSFHGFHGYDIDISLQVFNAGYSNYVIYDVLIEHKSKGNMNKEYYLQMMEIHKKWDENLPVFERNYPLEKQKEVIIKVHKERLKKLRKYLIRAHFSVNESAKIIDFYARKIGLSSFNNLVFSLPVQLFFIRLFSKWRRKMQ